MQDKIPFSRRLRRRVWRERVRIAEAILPAGLSPQRVTLGRPASVISHTSVSAVRAEAEKLWKSGKRSDAIELLRANALRPGGEELWWPLFHRLQQAGRNDAASLVIRSVVQLNPENLGALEQLIEDAHLRGPSGVVTEAFNKLPEVLTTYPSRYRLALFFVLPARHTKSLQVLRGSQDPVTAAVMRLYDSSPSGEDLHIGQENALPVAIYAMCTGRHGLAREALALVPQNEYPLDGLRITVRRLLRSKQYKAAHRYLVLMSPYLPSDRWVQEKLIRTGDGILTPHQLSRRGFPFSPRRKTAKYEPQQNTALYLLHNSLPYNSAGYATRTHGLLTAVAGLGWDMHAVTRLGYPFDMPQYRELEEVEPLDLVDGIPYHRLSTKNVLEMKKPLQLYIDRYTRELKKLAVEKRPFVLHAASNHWNGLAAVQAANQLGIESIYEVRGLWEITRGSRDPKWAKGGMFRFMARMEAEAAKGASRVITITHALKEELVSRGVDANKITVVPNGVDADRFEPQIRDQELAARLGVTGKPVIGYVGSVLDYEGLGLLVAAAEMLKAEGRKFAVMIVGDGAELDSFRAMVHEKQLEDVVIFTGRVPHEDVEKYYSLVDIAPFPRLPLPVCEMVSPLKPFEALAMQKAVVASDVAALAEIIQDGVTGLLHTKGSADDLKQKLALLLDNDELRLRLARQGNEWVRKERRWNGLGRLVGEIYNELGGLPRTAPHLTGNDPSTASESTLH